MACRVGWLPSRAIDVPAAPAEHIERYHCDMNLFSLLIPFRAYGSCEVLHSWQGSIHQIQIKVPSDGPLVVSALIAPSHLKMFTSGNGRGKTE